MNILTAGEIDLLNHRLAVPDALRDVLADDENDELAILANDDDAVDRACTRLSALFESKMAVERIIPVLTPLERWLLTDAVEGSTWVMSMHDSTISQQRTGAVRVAKSVVAKLRAAGLEVGDVPGT